MPFIAAVFADVVTGWLLQAIGYRRGAVAKYMVGALPHGATNDAMATDYGITGSCCPSQDVLKAALEASAAGCSMAALGKRFCYLLVMR